MPIPFTCQGCGLAGNAADGLAGKKARCKCGHVIDFRDLAPKEDLEVGRTEEGKVVEERTGLDRRVEKGSPPSSGERRSGIDRRSRFKGRAGSRRDRGEPLRSGNAGVRSPVPTLGKVLAGC